MSEDHQHVWENPALLEQALYEPRLAQIEMVCDCGQHRVIDCATAAPLGFGDLDAHQIDAVLSAMCQIARGVYRAPRGNTTYRKRYDLLEMAKRALTDAGINWSITGTFLADEKPAAIPKGGTSAK